MKILDRPPPRAGGVLDTSMSAGVGPRPGAVLCWPQECSEFPAGQPRFYPARRNAVRPVPPVSGSVPATRGCRSPGGAWLQEEVSLNGNWGGSG